MNQKCTSIILWLLSSITATATIPTTTFRESQWLKKLCLVVDSDRLENRASLSHASKCNKSGMSCSIWFNKGLHRTISFADLAPKPTKGVQSVAKYHNSKTLNIAHFIQRDDDWAPQDWPWKILVNTLAIKTNWDILTVIHLDICRVLFLTKLQIVERVTTQHTLWCPLCTT